MRHYLHTLTRLYKSFMSYGKCKTCGDIGELNDGFCAACYHIYVENDK